MTEHARPCILVAEGEHARLLRPGEPTALHGADDFGSTTAHLMAHELASDRPGPRVRQCARPWRRAAARSASDGRAKFAHFVAGPLCRAAASEAFDRLVLIAPARVLSDIEPACDEPTAAKGVGRLAKDAVELPNHALSPHVHAWIAAPHRVMSRHLALRSPAIE